MSPGEEGAQPRHEIVRVCRPSRRKTRIENFIHHAPERLHIAPGIALIAHFLPGLPTIMPATTTAIGPEAPQEMDSP